MVLACVMVLTRAVMLAQWCLRVMVLACVIVLTLGMVLASVIV